MQISGSLKGSSTSYKGKFEIPNLSEENDASEIDVNVSVTSDKDAAYKLKEFMRKTGQERIREQLAAYIRELREGDRSALKRAHCLQQRLYASSLYFRIRQRFSQTKRYSQKGRKIKQLNSMGLAICWKRISSTSACVSRFACSK